MIPKPRPIERNTFHASPHRPFRYDATNHRRSRTISTIPHRIAHIILHRRRARHRNVAVWRQHLDVNVSRGAVHAHPEHSQRPDMLPRTPGSLQPRRLSVSGHMPYCFCFFFASFLATTSPLYLMPLPLYGSGGLYALISAAVCPTLCLSEPRTKILICVGVSIVTSAGLLYSIAWENPSDKCNTFSRICARYPMPTSCSSFSNPSFTPITMLEMRDLAVPACAKAPTSSPIGEHSINSAPHRTFTNECSSIPSSPLGPLTRTRPSSTET